VGGIEPKKYCKSSPYQNSALVFSEKFGPKLVSTLSSLLEMAWDNIEAFEAGTESSGACAVV
jgi:hypothetical protein